MNKTINIPITRAITKENDLNPRQELFCQYYIMGDKTTYGNATKSYKKAYGIEAKKDDISIRAMASTLLTKQNIKRRLSKLIDEYINDTIVDKELAKVIKQNKELSPKVSAIREWNTLKQRIAGDKVSIEFNKYDWHNYSDK